MQDLPFPRQHLEKNIMHGLKRAKKAAFTTSSKRPPRFRYTQSLNLPIKSPFKTSCQPGSNISCRPAPSLNKNKKVRFWEESAVQKVQKVQTVQKKMQKCVCIHFRGTKGAKCAKKKSAFAHFPALPGRIDLCRGLHWIELSHKLK